MRHRSSLVFSACILGLGILRWGPVPAQDLEPRRWTPLPVGTSVVGMGYGRTTGDVFFDPVLNIENAEVELDTLVASYVRSFSLAGRLARFDAFLPWQRARWEGLLNGEPASVRRMGLADPIVRLSVNLFGAPAVGAAESGRYLASHPVNTMVGAAVAVTVPLGEYYDDKLINLGENRFTIRPQLGVVHNRGPWSYELTGSVFFHTDNNDFYYGHTREQRPIYALQAHVVRLFKPGLWVSLSAGYGKGGRSSIDDVSKDDERVNFLSALSAGVPVTRNQGLKLSYIRARAREHVGSDTDSLALAWSVMY